MDNCIFCKIINGEIPAKIVYQDDTVIAFNDIKPAAPTHILLVPRVHIASILELSEADGAEVVMASVLKAARAIAIQTGLDKNGFRLINNCGRDAGQTVDHVHFHLLGGRSFGEKLL